MGLNNKIQTYPWQDRSLANLRGEKWSDLPGLEGYYCVSNLGRVKRNAFEIEHKPRCIRLLPERMMKTMVGKGNNRSVGDTLYFLRVRIMREGIHYEYSIARLLYYSFVKKFNLQDYSRVVLARDGNGKNLDLKNLALVDIHHKQKRIFERDRMHVAYYYTYDEFLETGSDKSLNPFCKQVSQYTLKGKLIRTFPSIKAAAMVVGVSETGISSVLKKRQISSFGFVWGYGKKSRVDVAAIRQNNLEHFKKVRGQRVTQYDLEGKRVATYLTIADAGRDNGLSGGDISCALSGKQKTAGGFIWKKGSGKPTINVKGLVYGEALRAQRKWKPVMQYTPRGRYLKTYPSVKAAAEAVRCSPSTISIALKRENSLSYGYLWKFK